MISNVFSYLGNNSNPPDAMLKNRNVIKNTYMQIHSILLQDH